MINQPEFFSDFSPTPLQWTQLKAAVDEGHINRQFYLSMNGLLAANSIKLAALVSGSEILAFAFYADKKWMCEERTLTGRSLGLITTLKSHRRKGFSRKLIHSITEVSVENDIQFLYLQGIPNFYSKFGFHGFSPKRKFVFNLSTFKPRDCKVAPLVSLYREKVKQIYDDYCSAIGGYVRRSEAEWNDFFLSLSSTFLFYHPRVILDSDGRLIGYFCVSPTDPTQVKELAFIPTKEDALLACSALATYVQKLGAPRLEIYAPASGPIYSLCFTSIESDFICYLRPSSSNMMKKLSCKNLPKSFFEAFILQGDNL